MDEDFPWAAMEQEEERIWIQVRCWNQLTAEQARFLLELDSLRGYVRMPDQIHVNAHCWLTAALLSWGETEHWLTAVKSGRTSHGPYAPTGVREEQ